MKKAFLFLLSVVLAHSAQAQQNYRQHLSLAGEWVFALDPDSTIKATDKLLGDQITLPGTTDTNRKGHPLSKKDETTHLSRLYSYVGRAWYRKTVEIPSSWKGKEIIMHLERTKPTRVFIDGKEAGSSDDISTPQQFILTSYLKPGTHQITICVDNSERSIPPQVISNSHACTEDTQTNWNGIIGEMYLEARNPVNISNIMITPHADRHEVDFSVDISGSYKGGTEMRVMLIPWGSDYGWLVDQRKLARPVEATTRMRFTYQPDSALLWSEFHPNMYRLRIEIEGYDAQEKLFGFRDFTAKGTQFYINDNLTFLRGKHDACVFPLTAHVPMNVAEWRRYFQICKGYGINHVRFHSWCPPEACFLAADIEGIYLQPELPFWGDFKKEDSRLMSFLMKEGIHILQVYGHHPSFVMMALGNELWGDIPTMKLFTDAFRKVDGKKLYTFGSNYYLGYQGWKEGMDYFTTCRNGGEAWGQFNTHTRGSFSFADTFDGGMINSLYPNTTMNFSAGIKGCPVPIISHETAQFQTYPDYNEIRKYYGVLYPYNMEVFRQRLEKAGMLDQAEDFHKASGLWSVQLYKQDIEMDLRTPGFGGFQLLDLQDYPGQGSAYVGILDAFMESKGLTTPQEFRQWCSPIVPLLLMDKFCWTTDEPFQGRVQLANYSEPTGLTKWSDGQLVWQLQTESGETLREGTLSIPEESIGLTDVGTIQIDFSGITTRATRLNLVLHTYYNRLSSIRYTNIYPLWIYPAKAPEASPKDIIVAPAFTERIGEQLENGASVLLLPDSTQYRELTVGGLFQTDYWNYRMFKTISENNHKPVSPGTLGILCNPSHPIFRDFPTEMHTNWQWFPIIKASHPFMLDNTAPAYRPIVQVIDNIERNHKLGLIFEFAVGKGRLLVCMSPLQALGQYPEARQLYQSILQYMQSADFAPQTQISLDDLKRLFTTPVVEGKIGELNNISPY